MFKTIRVLVAINNKIRCKDVNLNDLNVKFYHTNA